MHSKDLFRVVNIAILKVLQYDRQYFFGVLPPFLPILFKFSIHSCIAILFHRVIGIGIGNTFLAWYWY